MANYRGTISPTINSADTRSATGLSVSREFLPCIETSRHHELHVRGEPFCKRNLKKVRVNFKLKQTIYLVSTQALESFSESWTIISAYRIATWTACRLATWRFCFWLELSWILGEEFNDGTGSHFTIFDWPRGQGLGRLRLGSLPRPSGSTLKRACFVVYFSALSSPPINILRLGYYYYYVSNQEA